MEANEIKTWPEIRAAYPDEWVLIGLSKSREPGENKGEVLLHGKDYLELCYKGSELPKGRMTKIVFTGEKPHMRKWLKLKVLKD